MAKNKPQKDLFASFAPEVKEETQQFQDMNEPEEIAKPEAVEENTANPQTAEPEPKRGRGRPKKGEGGRGPGRPKNPEEKKFRYTDVTGLEAYIDVRSKNVRWKGDKMYVAQYLRYLVLKDALENDENMGLFNILADTNNQRLKDELEDIRKNG